MSARVAALKDIFDLVSREADGPRTNLIRGMSLFVLGIFLQHNGSRTQNDVNDRRSRHDD